jgi:hypothetical protein
MASRSNKEIELRISKTRQNKLIKYLAYLCLSYFTISIQTTAFHRALVSLSPEE